MGGPPIRPPRALVLQKPPYHDAIQNEASEPSEARRADISKICDETRRRETPPVPPHDADYICLPAGVRSKSWAFARVGYLPNAGLPDDIN